MLMALGNTAGRSMLPETRTVVAGPPTEPATRPRRLEASVESGGLGLEGAVE